MILKNSHHSVLSCSNHTKHGVHSKSTMVKTHERKLVSSSLVLAITKSYGKKFQPFFLLTIIESREKTTCSLLQPLVASPLQTSFNSSHGWIPWKNKSIAYSIHCKCSQKLILKKILKCPRICPLQKLTKMYSHEKNISTLDFVHCKSLETCIQTNILNA